MQYTEILRRLKSLSSPEAVQDMAQYGISTKSTNYGIPIPELRKIARQIGKNHQLAQKLWNSDIRETKILAGMVDAPEMVTEAQMETWVREFDNWEICDQCCMNLFEKTEFAYQKCLHWSSREEEFIKRAGFVLMAVLAVRDKKAGDEEFQQFLPAIKREAEDSRNYVKKGVNWALRQIGKRSLSLNAKAIQIAREIQERDSKSARWIASDAIRELTSEPVQERLRRKLRQQ